MTDDIIAKLEIVMHHAQEIDELSYDLERSCYKMRDEIVTSMQDRYKFDTPEFGSPDFDAYSFTFKLNGVKCSIDNSCGYEDWYSGGVRAVTDECGHMLTNSDDPEMIEIHTKLGRDFIESVHEYTGSLLLWMTNVGIFNPEDVDAPYYYLGLERDPSPTKPMVYLGD